MHQLSSELLVSSYLYTGHLSKMDSWSHSHWCPSSSEFSVHVIMVHLYPLFTTLFPFVSNSLPLQYHTKNMEKIKMGIAERSTCPGGGGVLPYFAYTGMCRPRGSWFWSSWFRTGYDISKARSSSFVSSHLKLFKDILLWNFLQRSFKNWNYKLQRTTNNRAARNF